jgi:hypothetical protein
MINNLKNSIIAASISELVLLPLSVLKTNYQNNQK